MERYHVEDLFRFQDQDPSPQRLRSRLDGEGERLADAPQSAESLFRELMEHAPRESNPAMYETYMLAVRMILSHPEWKERFLRFMEKAPEYQVSYVAYIHTILSVLQKS